MENDKNCSFDFTKTETKYRLNERAYFILNDLIQMTLLNYLRSYGLNVIFEQTFSQMFLFQASFYNLYN